MYDLCIIGAGPAGATLARLVAGRYRVLLVDKRELGNQAPPLAATTVTAEQDKLCGGLLAPSAQKELARQGLGLPEDVVGGPQLFGVRTIDHDASLERLYQRFYINIDRPAFDRWLVSLVPRSVERAFGWRAETIEPDADAVTVRFATPLGGTASIRARMVVGADGAASFVRKSCLPAVALPHYVAIQTTHAGGAGRHYGAVFDTAVTDFYGWVVPKRDTMLVGAALRPGRGAMSRFDRFLESLDRDGFTLGDEIDRSSCRVARPSHASHLECGRGRVALIGEAAGLISPSSAEGISYALRSARALAGALEFGTADAVSHYRRLARPLALEVIAKMGKSAAIYGPLTRRLVMRTGLGAIDTASPIGCPAPLVGYTD